MRVNIGCGRTPTEGWRNFDNSPSLLLARVPLLPRVLRRTRLLSAAQAEFVDWARAHGVEHADATRTLPLATGSCEAVYSSHMLEHLDRAGATAFLSEALRVLAPGGVLRLAVPDLGRLVESYVASRDADRFIASSLLAVPAPRSLVQRLRAAAVGPRHHQWMYDGASLCALLGACGFEDAREVAAGETGLADPGALDLFERADESVYVEARKPR